MCTDLGLLQFTKLENCSCAYKTLLIENNIQVTTTQLTIATCSGEAMECETNMRSEEAVDELRDGVDGDVDEARSRRQARHRRDVAADREDEACAYRGTRLANRQCES